MTPVDPARRRFLVSSLRWAGAAAVFGPGALAGCGPTRPSDASGLPAHRLPIVSIGSPASPSGFSGDEFDRPHRAIMHLREQLDRHPVAESGGIHDVAIVGGGISGLAAAWYLRDLKPVLLEQAPRLGGNAKGERWGDLAYSIGAAYITLPDKDSNSEKLLADLSLARLGREEKAEAEAVVLKDGRLFSGFWQGATDPARAADFARVAERLKKVYDDEFPDLPRGEESALTEEQTNALDRTTFRQWAEAIPGGLHPHVEELFREYCWSSFAASWEELSAAQALNFLAADLQGIVVFPGGNAAIAQALAERLAVSLPAGHLRTEAVVLDVRIEKDAARVTYVDGAGSLQAVRARTVVFAAPKFVARAVLRGLESAHPEQHQAMGELKYRAYVVGNVLLRGAVASPSYELFRLSGRMRGRSEAQAMRETPFTDVIFGAWASHDRPGDSTLTLYRAVPYDGGRQELYDPGAFARIRREFEKEIPGVLAALNLKEDRVAGLRITRWGHPIPVARAGLIAGGVVQAAAAPVGGRIVFANQDNWANPAFETALDAAAAASEWVRERLGG